ncbi:MAG TPA: SpoIIE family protein phosphatase [Terracidiphilus sp.]|jgi:hypothetical protein|nr:SpoIIE family protein phosphatase [Terracidiphilus sp.]
MKAALIAVFALAASCGLMGQTSTSASRSGPAVPVTMGQSVSALTGPWRFHIGDDPNWADPSFDDSAWQPYMLAPGDSPLTLDQATQSEELPGWQQHGHPGYTGYAWYRIRMQPLEKVHSLVLLMPRYVDDAYEVYVNGARIGAFGRLNGWHLAYAGQPELYYIPAATLHSGQPVTIALRFWNPRNEALPSEHNLDGGLRGIPVIGPAAVIRVLDQSLQEQTWQIELTARPVMLVAVLYGAVGFISLFLFLFSRGQQEYLWAGISLTGFATMLASIVWVQQSAISSQASTIVQIVGDAAAIFAMPLAAMYLLAVPRSFWRQANYLVSALNLTWQALQLAAFPFGLLPPTDAATRLRHAALWVEVLSLFCLLLAIGIHGLRTIGKKAWLPMTPGLLFAFYCILYTLYSSGVLKGSYLFADFVCATVPLAVLFIFLIRFTEQQRENVRMDDDMRQAQEVQHLLVPQHLPHCPGWRIESEYRPARQVGGDFFQVLPADDRSLLIVIGDVSGKGLQAAMTVSAIVGALRDSHERRPAQVLAHLNRVLCGQIGGFVTCCTTLIADGGAMTIANAGHLSPYRNGEEVPLQSGLPLGIAPHAAYAESTLQLVPNDRLTFLSDGVVEAQSPSGELFGFDRTAAISNQSAEAIATAAQAHGQEDDITVLTLTFAPAEVLHA